MTKYGYQKAFEGLQRSVKSNSSLRDRLPAAFAHAQEV